MRNFRQLAWAAAAILGTAATASAQQTFPTSQTVSPTGAVSTTTAQAPTGGGGGGGLNIPGASSDITGGLSTDQNNFQLAKINQAPSLTTTNNTAIATSNFLRNTYGSVYYQGSDRSQVPNRIPGSFGTAIFAATGGATGGRGGAQGGIGAGGRGGSGSVIQGTNLGQIVALPKQIAYASQIQFKMPAGNVLPQLQTDLRGIIDRVPTTMLANPAGVAVAVNGRNVTLRGSVRDAEEANLLEGLVRLTPGVYSITNELTFPK